MLEANALPAHEALEAGYVHRVVPVAELYAAAAETAARMARRSPFAVAGTKRAFYEGATQPLDEGLAVERKWFLAAASTDAAKRAMRAYADEVEDSGPPFTNPDRQDAWREGTRRTWWASRAYFFFFFFFFFTVQLCVAGVGSTRSLPSLSTARTSILCKPFFSPL